MSQFDMMTGHRGILTTDEDRENLMSLFDMMIDHHPCAEGQGTSPSHHCGTRIEAGLLVVTGLSRRWEEDMIEEEVAARLETGIGKVTVGEIEGTDVMMTHIEDKQPVSP